MICLRCGCCCIHLDVAIPNPDAIRPDGTLDTSHRMPVVFKRSGEPCPHLTFADGMAVCRIHEMECYRGSPCDLFEQIGPQDDVCVLNAYFREIFKKQRARQRGCDSVE
ncbi:MAG: hypothetical protein NQU42_08360 [Methanothrix sp.]|uniref:hypothetical protein n=1 Tax=Methanothrix sp. TaxID=90426 RepID=UPI0025DE9B35|nr:hypothetical protein [Methanothrix sp.]MCQ8904083.1 hypothetical protein [Methanothrix sp.]